MSTVDGSLEEAMRHVALAACLTVLAVLPAAAQQQRPKAAPATKEFFALGDFHLTAAALGGGDDRFSWDTHFGGEIDLVDYVKGRTSIVIDYEALLGKEIRAFDPNQGNYTLEASSSYRAPHSIEIAGFLHHVSRHLGDRPKTFAIAWNVLGARVLRHSVVNGVTVNLDADLGWVSQRAYVDYQWIGNANGELRRTVSNKAEVYGYASGQLVGISNTESNRSTQVGGIIEAGVKFKGVAGGIVLFAGLERRIDADPLVFGAQNWVMAGFRLVSR